MMLTDSGLLGLGITPTAVLEVSGTISATNLVVNGLPVGGTPDRLISGSTSLIAQQDGAIAASGTLNVSGGILAQANDNVCAGTGDLGTLRVNPTTGKLQICHDR